MTSNPPQILPLTIFQAIGEHTLQLAGNLLHKQFCRDRSCWNAGFLHNWEGNTSLRTPGLHIPQKRYRLPNQNWGKGSSQCNVQFWILLMHHTENYPGFWTAESVPAIPQPLSPHVSTGEASWAAMKTEVKMSGKLSFGQTKPTIWQIFSCSGGAASVATTGSNIPGNCSMS